MLSVRLNSSGVIGISCVSREGKVELDNIAAEIVTRKLQEYQGAVMHDNRSSGTSAPQRGPPVGQNRRTEKSQIVMSENGEWMIDIGCHIPDLPHDIQLAKPIETRPTFRDGIQFSTVDPSALPNRMQPVIH